MSERVNLYRYDIPEISHEAGAILKPIAARFSGSTAFLYMLDQIESEDRKITNDEFPILIESLIRFLAWQRLAFDKRTLHGIIEEDTIKRIQAASGIRINDLKNLFLREYRKHSNMLAGAYRRYCFDQETR